MSEYLPYVGLASLIVGLASLIVAVATALTKVLVWTVAKWHAWGDRRVLEANDLASFYTQEHLRGATRCYVEPYSSNIDPSRETDMRAAVETREPIFKAMDRYFESPKYRHFLVLGDSGTGKTAFALNFYVRSVRGPRKARRKVAIVPLGQTNADKRIEAIPHKRSTVLILDAFDEDTLAIEDYRARLRALMDLAVEFERVVITCRTQFFRSDEEIPKEPGVLEVGVRTLGQQRRLGFQKLYLQPLTNEQIQAYLKLRYPGPTGRRKRRRAWEVVLRLPDLACRPMLLTYLPELVETGHVRIESSYHLYDVLTERWLQRDGDWFSGNHQEVLKLSVDLAVDLWKNRRVRGAEHIAHDELQRMAQSCALSIKEQRLVPARSLLNRTGDGHFKFAHRSIMEFLVLKARLEGRDGAEEGGWSDQMEVFLREAIVPGVAPNEQPVDLHRANLGGVHLQSLDLKNANLQDVNLDGAQLKDVSFKGANLEHASLEKADIQGSLVGANLTGARLARANLTLARLSDADLSHANLEGANLEGVSLKDVKSVDGANLSGANLTRADLQGMSLSSRFSVSLEGANLTHANLQKTGLAGAKLSGATLQGANLRGANLAEGWVVYGEGLRAQNTNLSNANLREANLAHADLTKADLTDVDLMGADLTGAILANACLPGADLSAAKLENANLQHANLANARFIHGSLGVGNDDVPPRLALQGAILRNAELIGASLTGANLMRVVLEKANLSHAVLTHANLARANLTGANVTDANLKSANLTGANLKGADLTGADLTGADLTDADLTDANFTNARLGQANLTGAKIEGVKMNRPEISGGQNP